MYETKRRDRIAFDHYCIDPTRGVYVLVVGSLIVAIGVVIFPLVTATPFHAIVLTGLLIVALLTTRIARVPWILAASIPYLALMVAWGRSFAYVGIGPLFVTELFLALVAPVCVWMAVTESSSSRPVGFVTWVIFVGFALFKIATAGSWAVDTLRNSVIGLYSVFYLIGWYLGCERKHLGVVELAGVIAVLLNLGPFLANVVMKNAWEQQSRITGGNEPAAALALLLPLISARWSSSRVALLLFAPILGYQVLISYHRSLWLGLLVGTLTIFIVDYWRRRSIRSLVMSTAKMIPGWIVAVFLFLLTPWYLGHGTLPLPTTPISARAISEDAARQRQETEPVAASQTATLSQQPNALHVALRRLADKFDLRREGNATWRWWAWSTAMDSFLQAPVLGISMDKPVLPTRYRGVPTDDPHNSYLALLTRFGIVGFGIFLAFWGGVVTKILRSLAAVPPDSCRYRTGLYFFAAHVLMAVFAAMNVVLEGPHHGMLFWLTLGLAAAVLQNSQEKSTPASCEL